MAIMAAALDAAPLIKRQWAENAQRSDMVKSALTAMEAGRFQECADTLSSLVEKAGGSHCLNSGKVEKAFNSDRTRLLQKRNELLAMRDQLRSMRKAAPSSSVSEEPTAITLPPNVTAVTAAQRLTKADLDRKEALAHRLELIRGQLGSRRNWQPLKLRKAALAMQLNQLREECTT
jgi:hypothetical protein